MLACEFNLYSLGNIKTASKREAVLFRPFGPVANQFSGGLGMFSVSPKVDVSLRALQALHSSGHFVARSSHIGNHYLSNLLLWTVGLPALLFDRNLFQRDVNYHPGHHIIGGKITPLNATKGLVPFGRDVCQVHLAPLRSLFAGLCPTEAEYFSAHADVVQKVFALMAKHMPHVFDRYLCACGEVYKLLMSGNNYVADCPACGRTLLPYDSVAESAFNLVLGIANAENGGGGAQTGVLWSLPLHLVLESILNVLDSGKNVVYQLSGPDMIRYTRNGAWLSEVRWVWAVLQKQAPAYGLDLPEEIHVHVVPTAEMRFGYIQGHEAGRLVVEGLLGLEAYKKDRTSPARADYLEQVRTNLAGWNVFYDIQDPTSWPCSHHDLAHNRLTLVIPEVVMNMNMEAVRRLFSDSQSRLFKSRH